MRTEPIAPTPFEPRAGNLLAAAACIVAALLLLWPLLSGQIMFGGARSDMYIAGYSFRLFGADMFKATGAIPQWNPYLFGGLPYIAAMHGDIFYPTAWLRWIMPVDLAITWGMAVHFALAGWLTFRLARALGVSWGGAIVAGLAYELTGIVASQMSPGHDGKLFVSALTPLAFWVLLRAIRDRQRWAFGALSFVVALTVLGHYHMSYFLLIALGLWTLYLVLWHPERATSGSPWVPLALAAVAVVVGVAIASLQTMPFLEYIKYSPRAEGGPNTGWAFATSFALPPSELVTALLPQFNGMLDHYWGQNPLKFHTEYVGFLPVALAGLALGDQRRRRLVVALSLGALLFLLFAFGGNTPFYRPFFELLPMLNKIRAMGMVFFLVAFPISLLAGIGFDRVLTRTVAPRTVLLIAAGFAAFALLGVVGALQNVAQTLALPERLDAVEANAPYLVNGAWRLLAFVTLGSAALWAAASGKLAARGAVVAVAMLTAVDLWSIDRQFFQFSPRAKTLFADDAVTTYLRSVKPPYRVIDIGNSYGYSILMAYRIPSAMGYHGFELRHYDELGGKSEGWNNLLSPNLLELLAIRYLIFSAPQTVPGYHQVVASTTTSSGQQAVLYERDTLLAYARVIPSAAKLPEDQVVPTLLDPRFPFRSVVLLPDSSSAHVDSLRQPFPVSKARATVTEWAPGRMRIAIDGADAKAGNLLISENWYPDWHARIDGAPATVRRADHALLSVDLPPGAREVTLRFDSPAYARGKLVSIVALLVALGMLVAPLVAAPMARRRRALTGPHD